MRIKAHARTAGFTLVEIMIVIAIIGLLAAIAFPNLVKARTKSQKTACIKNLQMIDGAKETWALESKRGIGDTVVESEVNGYIKGGAPVCPANGSYRYNPLSTAPTCSIEGHVLPESGAGGGAGGTTGGSTGGSTSGSGSDGSGSSGGNPGPGGGTSTDGSN
jgi:prepilin-type N-terminal cleavage/methylation domain-containing protein